MGSGGRIDHQTHHVGVGATDTDTDTDQAGTGTPDDGRLWHTPDSQAIHSLAMDPTTGEMTVFYHRHDDGGGASRGYPLSNVGEDTWQRLTTGDESVGRLVQQLANDPAHRPEPPPASDAAQRLIDALRSSAPSEEPPVPMPVQRRATAAAEAELAAGQRDADTARDAAPEPARPAVSYVADPAAFQRDYDEAQQRRERGEPVVPYLREDATGGLGARDGGRAFGVEIEFDLPGSPAERNAAREAIARDLHTAGITQDNRIHGYHAGRGRDGQGYTDAANGWRLENDVSVSGELVSPIMYDEPHTWSNLEQACEIIRRHGGQASVRAGSHVTVSTGDYGNSVERHNRLLNTFSAYEDTLYRLATDPQRGRHRITQGSQYCSPNRVPATGYQSIDAVRAYQGGHYTGLNLQHSNGRASDRAEFRLWDATLDPATIQAQIKLSLGIADAAARGATGDDVRREPVGTHRDRNPRGGSQGGEAWQAATESFRSLVDSVFHRSADKAQMTALFAATRRWQRTR